MPLTFDPKYPIPKAAQASMQGKWDACLGKCGPRVKSISLTIRGVTPERWSKVTPKNLQGDATWYYQSRILFAKLDGHGSVQDADWEVHEFGHAVADELFTMDTWHELERFFGAHWADLPSDYCRKYKKALWDENRQPGRGLTEPWAECFQACYGGGVLHAGLHLPKLVVRQEIVRIVTALG